jgi:hypothetical protein
LKERHFPSPYTLLGENINKRKKKEGRRGGNWKGKNKGIFGWELGECQSGGTINSN